MEKNIKICYIGGGSKSWARIFMVDLALASGLSGEIALYDIDIEAAERNARIGGYINKDPKTVSKFEHKVYTKLEDALSDADFVIISILPGTFKEMRSDVHTPEKYGIYQSVGDTAGPGGVLRAMRTVPIYEEFASKIKEICPNAWVLNLTNPMSICTKTLYDTFPEIKAFGCCHEVFHAQDFLALVLREIKGVKVHRSEIFTDVSGINHFTWFTKANWRDVDIISLLPEFIEKYYEDGYCEREGADRFAFVGDPFAYGNKVKLDMFMRFGALGGAGDRHLVEFMPGEWYLKDRETIENWKFNLTTVDLREENQKKQIADSIAMSEGKLELPIQKSGEEAVDLMKALLGFGKIVSNVNTVNRGQMPQMPLGSIVETNCVFTNDNICPVLARPLPEPAYQLVYRACINVDYCYKAIKERDLEKIYYSFRNQALCDSLSNEDCKELFKEMCYNTREYLDPYFDIDAYFNK